MAAAAAGRADLKVCIASTRQHIFGTSQTLQNFNLAASVDVLKMAFAAQIGISAPLWHARQQQPTVTPHAREALAAGGEMTDDR